MLDAISFLPEPVNVACHSLNIYLSVLPDNENEYNLISNIVNEDRTPYGMEYISLLARQGKIDAYKEGKRQRT